MKAIGQNVGLVALLGASIGVASAAEKPFQSTKGYSITPPARWNLNGSGVMGTDVVIAAPPAKNYAAHLNIVVIKAAPGETLEADLPKINAAMPKTLNSYKRVSQKITSIGGVRALETVATHKIGTPPRKLWMHQTLVLLNGQGYTFTCTALDGNHKTYEPAFKAMLKSVRWKK